MIYDLAIVGGGPAGCAAAISAARRGLCVFLAEKGRFPRHKVCGEFVSPESHAILTDLLGPNHPLLAAPARILRARIFVDGRCIEFSLPAPGWSIPRYELDRALWESARSNGVDLRDQTAVKCANDRGIEWGVQDIRASVVVNASGRWSNLQHSTSPNSAPRYLGLKAHFSGENAPPSTDIYFFDGGYCGIQPLSAATLNASAMVRADVATSLEQAFSRNAMLWSRSRAWEQITETVTTAPLIHGAPQPVTDGVMNAGDAAGFIDPFTGDGISLALHSGKLAADCAVEGGPTRYAYEYLAEFGQAFRTASFARFLSRSPEAIRRVAALAFRSEWVKKWALRQTRAS